MKTLNQRLYTRIQEEVSMASRWLADCSVDELTPIDCQLTLEFVEDLLRDVRCCLKHNRTLQEMDSEM